MSNATKYIISGKGFLKSIEFVSEINHFGKKKCIWTKTLQDAKAFTSNQAKGYIDIINKMFDSEDSCFIWSPFDETCTKGLYEVNRRASFYNISSENEHSILEWYIRKVTVSKSDLSVLNDMRKDKLSKQYYSFEEATEIAKQKNLIMLEELLKVLNAVN